MLGHRIEEAGLNSINIDEGVGAQDDDDGAV